MSLLINPLLLATLAAIMTISSTQDQGPGSCPHVEVLRGRDGGKGEMGLPGAQGERGMAGPRGPVGEKGAQGDPGMSGGRGEPGPQGVQGSPAGGTVYTRWGRTTCPTDHGTQLLYAGRAGGTPQEHRGGAANRLCLPNDPDHLQHQSEVQRPAHIAGLDYYYSGLPSLSSKNYCNAPCAVCYVAIRSVAVMIPAKTQCPTNWTLEYVGYLMSEWYNLNGRSMYECVDKDPECLPGLRSDNTPRDGRFHLVEPYCDGLECPPYDAEKELACAVCTR